MLPKDLKESLLAGEYERTPEGVFFPSSNLMAKGVFRFNKRGEPEEESENLVVDQALDYILNAAIGASSPIATWYVATFTGPGTVLDSWDASNFVANAIEWTNYVSATRPIWDLTGQSVTDGGIDSFSTKAEFESTADGQTVTGAALISSSAKGVPGGTCLMAASRFPSTKNLDLGEILDVGYGLQLTAV